MRRYLIIVPFLFAACATTAPKQVTYATPQPVATVASSAERPAVLPGHGAGYGVNDTGYLEGNEIPGGP
jgi:hypothetical protein